MKIVIVGAVAAGTKTACRARRLLPDAEITVVDQDRLISYGGCGIPYFISGEVESEKHLRSTSYNMLRDERFFRDAKGVRVLSLTRAVAIDRIRKVLEIEDLRNNERGYLAYDKLVLATGSAPLSLPLAGIDLDGVYALASLEKAIAIKEDLTRGRVSRAVIIGAGGIGLEMAEALADMWQIPVSLVEFMPQILPGLITPVFARMITNHLRTKGVEVYLGESVKEILPGEDSRVNRVITTRRELAADLVIVAAGVRPRGELAAAAGLEMGQRGGVVVNRRMQTSDPDIYAAGDCVEIVQLVTGKRTVAPLGSLANRQGRVVGDNLAGLPSTFDGWIGTFIMKIFDLVVGSTGLSAEAALREGFSVVEACAIQTDRAHFYPEAELMFMNMVVDKKTRRVLGLQGIASRGDGLLARINAAAGLVERKAVIEDFSNLELAYAPPFSNAVDILNSAANVADNILAGRLRGISPETFIDWMEGVIERGDWLTLDLRYPKEAEPFLRAFPDRWTALPYDSVRSGYEGLPLDRTLILMCNSATRAYEIQCFLDGIGRTDTLVVFGAGNVLRRLGLAWWPA